MRARSAGLYRAAGRVLIDGTLDFALSKRFVMETGPSANSAHRIEQLPGGWDVTSPDGARLLLSAGPGQAPKPQPGVAPYDIALLDLLAYPAQLGQLRRAGLVHAETAVGLLYADHRISSEKELARRCELWRAVPGHDGQLISRAAAGVAAAASTTGHAGSAASAGSNRTLIIGGARSGKSTEAELRLAGEPQVTYLAAGPYPGTPQTAGDADASPRPDSLAGPDSWAGPDREPDSEWAQRVATHRARRPAWWQTVESLDVAGVLRRIDGPVLLDGIGTWLAGVLDQAGMWEDDEPARWDVRPRWQAARDPAEVVQAKIDELVDAWRQTSASVVAVTDQVGSGLVPAFPAGRVFRDQLGWLNQRLAAESEVNLLVVAGRVIPLPE